MHSTIYQVSRYPIVEDERVNSFKVDEGEMVDIDYADTIDNENRKELIIRLAKFILPLGMFTLNPDLSMTYNGGFKEWCETYTKDIYRKANAINPSNVMQWIGPTYQLQKAIVNPLGTDSLFITDFEDNAGTAERSADFMRFIEKLQPGDKLYFGSVMDYHF